VPLKNDFSHVHDAKQYLDLGLTKRGVLADGALRDGPVGPPQGDRNLRARRRQRVDFGTGPFAHREARA
jgi:hypothetical protein